MFGLPLGSGFLFKVAIKGYFSGVGGFGVSCSFWI
jgi:hypothetical protein